MNRKALACILIVVAAVAIIVTTVVIRAGHGDETKHATDQPLAAGLTTSALSEAEIRSAVGDDALATTSRFNRPAKAPAKVDPATCAFPSTVVAPGSFAGVDWVGIRGSVVMSPSSQHSHYVAQGLTVLDTPETARKYLQTSAQQWQGCNEKSYTVDVNGTVGHWVMKSFNQTETTLTAAISQENSQYACQHVLTYETKYIIDAEVCGYDTSDQAQIIANRIASKLNNNLENP